MMGKPKGKGTLKHSNKGSGSTSGLSGLEQSNSDASSEHSELVSGTHDNSYTKDRVWFDDGWSFADWNDEWSSVGWHECWVQNVQRLCKFMCTWKFGSWCHEQSETV